MEERLFDYGDCARIWRRVAPELAPYPRAEQPPLTQDDPCCMGTEAAESVEVLRGFVCVELCTQRRCADLALRCRDALLRRCFGEFSRLAAQRSKRLRSALYLITGENVSSEAPCCPPYRGERCALLRALYHDAACSGFNYARAAQETADLCLQKLLASCSREEYCRAERLLDLLAGRL